MKFIRIIKINYAKLWYKPKCQVTRKIKLKFGFGNTLQ